MFEMRIEWSKNEVNRMKIEGDSGVCHSVSEMQKSDKKRKKRKSLGDTQPLSLASCMYVSDQTLHTSQFSSDLHETWLINR